MASISNLILSHDQEGPIFSPLISAPQINPPNTSDNPEDQAISQELLAEIKAIQDAMLSNESFDFSSLEPTAAGNTNDSPSNLSNNKSASQPILLEDDSVQINYRSETSSASETEATNNTNEPNSIFTGDSILGNPNKPNSEQFTSSVSEDFITEARGTFSAKLNVTAQTIESEYGSLSIDDNGHWLYSLNNQSAEIQALAAGVSLNETISLITQSGKTLNVVIQINGTNDQALISGLKYSDIQADKIEHIDNTQLPTVSGKLNVTDQDLGEARFDTNFDIKGSFGTAQINAQGEWTYTLNNYADAVQGLRAGDKLLDLFTIKTLDGTKQLIQINIEGADDKPILGGKNFSVLDLESDLDTTGSLTINDPDFGQSSFQALSGITSSLGYGTAEINTQGTWTFTLDREFASENLIPKGQTYTDSFEVFTADGTSQTILIPIKGSDSPAFAKLETGPSNSAALSLNDVLIDDTHELGTSTEDSLTQDHSPQSSFENSLESSQAESILLMNNEQNLFGNLANNVNDIIS